MPPRFVTTSLVTKRAGIAARFVILVTKRAATKFVIQNKCVRRGREAGRYSIPAIPALQ